MNETVVQEAFCYELHNEIRPPQGWEWIEPLPGFTVRIMYYRNPKDMNFAIHARESGVLVKFEIDESSDKSLERTFQWEDPRLIEHMTRFINEIALTWEIVYGHSQKAKKARESK